MQGPGFRKTLGPPRYGSEQASCGTKLGPETPPGVGWDFPSITIILLVLRRHHF